MLGRARARVLGGAPSDLWRAVLEAKRVAIAMLAIHGTHVPVEEPSTAS
jgi:hypothetical protein